MTTVSSVGLAKLGTQTMSKLFGSIADASASSSASDAVLEITSGYKVSGTTTGALAGLSIGGTTTTNGATKTTTSTVDSSASLDTTTDDLGSQGVIDGVELEKRINNMTSQQISDAMYGDGIQSFSGRGNDTFQMLLDDQKDSIDWQFDQAANNTSLSDALRKNIFDTATELKASHDSLQAAYDDHTLKIQKGSDVEGLDDTQYEHFGASGKDAGGVSWAAITGSYNADFTTEKFKTINNGVVFWAGVSMYLSWDK